jgi:hypothetical protein
LNFYAGSLWFSFMVCNFTMHSYGQILIKRALLYFHPPIIFFRPLKEFGNKNGIPNFVHFSYRNKIQIIFLDVLAHIQRGVIWFSQRADPYSFPHILRPILGAIKDGQVNKKNRQTARVSLTKSRTSRHSVALWRSNFIARSEHSFVYYRVMRKKWKRENVIKIFWIRSFFSHSE